MRKVIFIFSFIILGSQCMITIAQDREERHERIKAMKIAYITERIELTTDEAEKFWPVYNDYESRKINTHEELRKLHRYYAENQDNITEEKQVELLNKYIKLQKQDAELLTIYHDKFIEILPPDKVMKLYIAEVQFKSYLLRQLREHKGQGPDRGQDRRGQIPPL